MRLRAGRGASVANRVRDRALDAGEERIQKVLIMRNAGDRPAFPTVVHALQHWARHRPDSQACVFLKEGEDEDERLSFGELDRRSRAIGAALGASIAPGERALLLFSSYPESVAAFLGCLYAGVIAVPCPRPRPRRLDRSVPAIAADCGPAALVTSERELRTLGSGLREVPILDRLPRIVVDEIDRRGGAEGRPRTDPESIAYLQYTSGSTSRPRGVMMSHGNVARNLHMAVVGFELPIDSSAPVCWIPLHHDMGLVGHLLCAIYFGWTAHIMPPLDFVQAPIRWLRALSESRANFSVAPSFAYEHCVARIGSEQCEGLDLSHWHRAGVGSEPIRAQTLRRFAEAFAPYGFRPEALFPCYGLAEATLFVAGGPAAGAPRVLHLDRERLRGHQAVPIAAGQADARAVGAVGRVPDEICLRVVDPERRRALPELAIGEIWISGPSIARGYWQRPEASAETFQAHLDGDPRERRFLRTGDLGFRHQDQLFIVGRIKDLIIIHGRNHHPEDVEETVGRCHAELRGQRGAAFVIDGASGEALVVVQEVRPKALRESGAEIAATIRGAVTERHEIRVHDVLLVRPGAVPKTSSGKIRRKECRTRYLDGLLEGQSGARPGPPPEPTATTTAENG